MSYYETLSQIALVKKTFEKHLEQQLNIVKVQSPLFVRSDSGLQDCLSGVERPLCFFKGEDKFEVVQSLAKWKRDALGRYGFEVHSGLYTDMKAVRQDEVIDDIHSLFVEQWDWEKVIEKSDRTIDYLKKTVREIYTALISTVKELSIDLDLPSDITFIDSQQLEDKYPKLSSREREYQFVKEKKAVFIIGIGDKLKSGKPHDLRSPDYDDWSLNGDILIFDEVIDKALEISSMGIRVDSKSLLYQLKQADCTERILLPYHKAIINDQLPLTIGGGIGQSRFLMLLLKKSHISEVQASSWTKEIEEGLKGKEIL